MEIKVLDYGYVKHIESWGGGESKNWQIENGVGTALEYEAGIIEAARQSTQGSFRGWAEDEKLLKYLFNSVPQHSTPFEFAGMVIEVQAPIFVFREWHRHRTQSYNEMSARYAPLPDVNYIPTMERLMINSKENKQAGTIKDADELNEGTARAFQLAIAGSYQRSEDLYQAALKRGVPKELARVILPVGRYSKMRASANHRNWLAFLTLRNDPKAQWEIQQYAKAVASIIQEFFPHVYKLHIDKQWPTVK